MNKKVGVGVLITVVAIFITTFTFVLVQSGKLTENSIVAKVDGEPITVREFTANLKYRYYASTFTYFNIKYGAEQSADFWTEKFGNESPAAYARENTLKYLVGIKVQQKLMKEYGIVTDISYKSFLKALGAENESRHQAVLKKKIIYGPEVLGENEYFEYTFNQNIESLKEKLGESVFQVSENELRKEYEEEKKTVYSLPDYIKLEVISVPRNQTESGTKEGRKLIESAMKELKAGRDFDKVSMKYNEDGKVHERVVDENSLKRDSQLIKEEAAKVQAGQISGIIDMQEEGYQIIKCVERINNRFKDFEAEKQNINKAYVTKEYNDMVAKLVQAADVKIEQSVYTRILP